MPMCTVLATLLRRLLIALIVMVEYFSDPSYMKTAITRGAFAIWLRSWSEAVISRREGKKGEELPSAVCLQTGLSREDHSVVCLNPEKYELSRRLFTRSCAARAAVDSGGLSPCAGEFRKRKAARLRITLEGAGGIIGGVCHAVLSAVPASRAGESPCHTGSEDSRSIALFLFVSSSFFFCRDPLI